MKSRPSHRPPKERGQSCPPPPAREATGGQDCPRSVRRAEASRQAEEARFPAGLCPDEPSEAREVLACGRPLPLSIRAQRFPKRQSTAALQDAGATTQAPRRGGAFGVRRASGALGSRTATPCPHRCRTLCLPQPKRQRAAALQDAGATSQAPRRGEASGVRRPSGAFGFAGHHATPPALPPPSPPMRSPPRRTPRTMARTSSSPARRSRWTARTPSTRCSSPMPRCSRIPPARPTASSGRRSISQSRRHRNCANLTHNSATNIE
jgi:hypothetical protein